MHVVFAGFFVVSFIIGIIAFFLGCNPHLDNQCVAYKTIQGTVYDYKFTTETCKKCVSRSNNHCTRYDYYPCYSAYVKFRYGSNETCSLETEKDSRSESEAKKSVNKYDIGEKEKLLKAKSGSACSEPTTGMITWGVGVAFLTLSGLVLCGWLAFAVFVKSDSYNTGNTFTPTYNNTNMAKVTPIPVAEANYERF